MIFKFYKNPEDVLSEFYFNCGIETKLYQNHKKKDLKTLSNSLMNLYQDNQLNEFVERILKFFFYLF